MSSSLASEYTMKLALSAFFQAALAGCAAKAATLVIAKAAHARKAIFHPVSKFAG
jgi:hypothetical protein